MELPKKYDPLIQEEELIETWKKEKLYSYKKNKEKKNYTIDTPPPTVSGRMHVGHACSYSHGDIIARYKRMRGYNVFYPFGTDDNGLATEKLVEKLKKVDSKKMSRSEFIALCEKTLKEIKPEFVADWVRIGVSAEFENSYSTIEKHARRTSQKSFVDLYKKGRVFREESPVSWCVKCQTSIAQAEFESVEMDSSFSDIIFQHKGKELVISTTRPELLAACVALAAHPADKRYSDLKGKFAKVPLFDFDVPIIFDETVDKEKGTGLMMVCTFGDKEDIEKWKKHNLPLKTIFEPYGKLNEHAKQYKGMNIKDARKAILSDLEKKRLLLQKKHIKHHVNVHERCGTEVEYLKTTQWFVKILDKKQELIDAADKISWNPSFMKKRYVHWVENLNWDWCISRQRHFGIPFPVWHSKKTGEIIVADEKDLPVDPFNDKPRKLPTRHTFEDIVPETDVMDTWNTSSLTPQIALNWVEDPSMNDSFPEDLRMQAHDIIRTWAFYTIVKGLYHENSIPWKNIMISGFVLDPKGEKMSKSKGNVIEPEEVVSKYGADAMRFWTATSKLGEDLPFMEKDVVTGKKTVNKIWNASKFTIMNLEGFDVKKDHKYVLGVVDRWMLTKLQRTIKSATESLDSFEYSKARHVTDNFFWNTFCDNYLEFVKHRVYGDELDVESKEAAEYVLYTSLLAQLKLYAPIMPFVTDYVYRMYFADKEKKKSIHLEDWPEFNSKMIDEEAEKTGDLLVYVISEVRKFKSQNGLSLREDLKKVVISGSEDEVHRLRSVEEDLLSIGKIEEAEYDVHKEKGLKIKILK